MLVGLMGRSGKLIVVVLVGENGLQIMYPVRLAPGANAVVASSIPLLALSVVLLPSPPPALAPQVTELPPPVLIVVFVGPVQGGSVTLVLFVIVENTCLEEAVLNAL